MINKYSILSSLVLLLACHSKEKKTENKSNTPPIETTAKTNEVVTNEKTTVVRNFIKWYKNNIDLLYQFNTIDGGGGSENETPKNYSVNFKEVDKYLLELKKSNFFTPNFIAHEKQAFIEGDTYFKENPQNDGPPYGFDYDPFFMTQDAFEEDLKNTDKIDFTTKNSDSNTASVEFSLPICGMKYKYSLKKENSNWQIDKIENISDSN